ncbi:hypothetical protein BH24CHL1_BH24CHL1_15360 [soil metagenome]
MGNVKPASTMRIAARPPIPLVGLLLAFAVVTILAFVWLQVPLGEFRDLVLFLSISAVASTAFGVTAFRWSEAGRRSIRTKILMAYGVGVLIVIVNILVTARLMFISSHDLGLLVVLLVFGAIFSVSFGAAVAERMTSALQRMTEGARAVARGDLSARVQVWTNDELSDLAASFNDMVENVTLATEERNRADESRRELVAAVSHDLRTPLAAIQAMLEALTDGVVSDELTVRRYHTTMRSQVTHLSRLIDDLFELSQLEAHANTFEMIEVDLSAVVESALEGVAMSAVARDIRVDFIGDGPVPVKIDPTRIARVVANLVDNALRHAPDGSTVRVSVAARGKWGTVTVQDEGSGIDPDGLELIFTRFYRGEKSRSRSHGGAGLGLAIARGIIEAHGGTVWAENGSGAGARFTFTVPVR